MITDLQGIVKSKKYILTDSALHSVDKAFGATDYGDEGIEAFFKTHYCSKICKDLKLEFHPKQPKEAYSNTGTHIRDK